MYLGEIFLYTLQMQVAINGWTYILRESSSSSVEIYNLTAGNPYSFRAQTSNFAGNLTGPFGSEINYVVKGLPSSPQSVSVSTYDTLQNSLVVSWERPGDDGGNSNITYIVQYSGGITGIKENCACRSA